MEQAPETESERIEREIQALLAKKEALQHEERKRQIAEEARKVDLLVESSPVKKKDPTVFQHVTNLVAPPKQPLFLSKSLIAGPSSQPKAGPSRSKPTPQLPRPSSQAHSNNSLSSALHRSRQGNLEDDSEGAERGGKKRTEVDLTVVENLTMGPKDYGLDATGLDGWKWVEPNSGVNLKERIMPHPQVQSNLSDRYILNPSQIYSTMRLSADKQHYTLPVDAGWVVIGVVCHKGEIKVTQRRKTADTDKNGKRRGEADGAKEEEDDDDDDDHDLGTDPSKRRKTQNGTSVRNPTSSLRKFITLKICSLPPRNAMHSATQGDAILNLMLFEADCADTIPGETGEPSKKIYRGGSGGAYETWWKLAVGAVVGVVSPKILKPFGDGKKGPHPLTHPVGLTPTGPEDIFLIGRARDLGTCLSIRKDGKQCTEWVDLRMNQYCEYHVVGALKGVRAGRAEFASSTGGFELAMKANAPSYFKGKPPKGAPNAFHKHGLQSGNNIVSKRGFDDGGGQTYIVGGQAISEKKAGKFADEHVAERMGRDKQTSLKRKTEMKAREQELERLMERDSSTTGAKYLEAAGKLRQNDSKDQSAKKLKAQREGLTDNLKTRPFHATAIKLIGFDPTTAANEGGLMVEKGAEGLKRLEAIASLRNKARPAALLGNMSGAKSMSNASNPLKTSRPAGPVEDQEEPMINLDDSDDE